MTTDLYGKEKSRSRRHGPARTSRRKKLPPNMRLSTPHRRCTSSRRPADPEVIRAPLAPGAAVSRCPPPPLLSDMSRPSTSSTAEKAPRNVLWGGELNQEKRTCTFRPQVERKENCRLLLSAICLGEKAKEEVNRVEILPSGNQEDKKTQPITIASLKASVLPMVTMTGVELSPPVTFQLRAGSGPVFLSGQEYYGKYEVGHGQV
ncbi:Nucleoplasmin-2 [Sciurus carolinensis]|uniref:Nucleoplasmin-2 n=1 Tax=Sciurus carolinensis TaxID=30640 RepID=A0AA41MY81_SCICA|nr:Nucleoplasmin-2 [Sciurus carolinensis]